MLLLRYCSSLVGMIAPSAALALALRSGAIDKQKVRAGLGEATPMAPPAGVPAAARVHGFLVDHLQGSATISAECVYSVVRLKDHVEK